MYSSPESRDPDSDDVCSACVRNFQKRDGETQASREIWEKGLGFVATRWLPPFGRRRSAPHASDLALHSASRVAISRLSIFGLTTWTCFGNEAADEFFQTLIDSAPAHAGQLLNFVWRVEIATGAVKWFNAQ